MRYRKLGTIVEVVIDCFDDFAVASGAWEWSTIALLPSGYRPSMRFGSSGFVRNKDSSANGSIVSPIFVETDGRIRIYDQSGEAQIWNQIYWHATFFSA